MTRIIIEALIKIAILIAGVDRCGVPGPRGTPRGGVDPGPPRPEPGGIPLTRIHCSAWASRSPTE